VDIQDVSVTNSGKFWCQQRHVLPQLPSAFKIPLFRPEQETKGKNRYTQSNPTLHCIKMEASAQCTVSLPTAAVPIARAVSSKKSDLRSFTNVIVTDWSFDKNLYHRAAPTLADEDVHNSTM
jgi:hypothetical protein